MFDFHAVFQNVLASLQNEFASMIVQFVTSLFGSILSGLLPGG